MYFFLNAAFRNLDLFPSSGKKKVTPTLLGLLERVSLNHWTYLEIETIPVSETSCLKKTLDDGQSP
jgi:hypothetical protein